MNLTNKSNLYAKLKKKKITKGLNTFKKLIDRFCLKDFFPALSCSWVYSSFSNTMKAKRSKSWARWSFARLQTSGTWISRGERKLA